MRAIHYFGALGVLAFTVSVLAAPEPISRKVSPAFMDGSPAGQTLPEGPLNTTMWPANNCDAAHPLGILGSAGGHFEGDTYLAGDDFGDDFDPSCMGNSPYSTGHDEVWEFFVDSNGRWTFDTCTKPAGWDTNLGIYRDIGIPCPGVPYVCNGDDPCGYYYESAIRDVCLTAGVKYWLVVDGWSPTYWFPGTYYNVSYALTTPPCLDNAGCDDGDICNGVEECVLGCCVPGDPYCEPWETCLGVPPVQWCENLNPQCYTWLSTVDSPYYFPRMNHCPGPYGEYTYALADDVELVTGAGRELIWFSFEVHARDGGGAPQGSPYNIETGLWHNSADTSCLPLGLISGTDCDYDAIVMPGGSPADVVLCEPAGGMPTGIMLPDRSGDTDNCEVDFFIWYRVDYDGVGFGIGGGNQQIGGMAATDDYGGTNVFFLEGGDACDTAGDWAPGAFGAPLAGFMSIVCTVPSGPCCHAGGCSEETQASCDALDGIMAGLSDPSNPMSCSDWDADFDGDGHYYGCDNCPDVPNPAQADCDDDHSCYFDPDTKEIVCEGEGDACEPDAADQDKDGDGWCNGVDECPNDPAKHLEGQCGCGEDEIDSDGDCDPAIGPAECVGHCMDCVDECNNDPKACVLDPFCGCPWTPYDWDDDGVPNCEDQCPGIDDAIFAPDCKGAIPTVSEWGLMILALLLLVAGKVYFSRRATA